MAGVDDRKDRVPEAGPHKSAPKEHPRDRGWREADPEGADVLPGREFGAGGQVDDGPGANGPPKTPRP